MSIYLYNVIELLIFTDLREQLSLSELIVANNRGKEKVNYNLL